MTIKPEDMRWEKDIRITFDVTDKYLGFPRSGWYTDGFTVFHVRCYGLSLDFTSDGEGRFLEAMPMPYPDGTYAGPFLTKEIGTLYRDGHPHLVVEPKPLLLDDAHKQTASLLFNVPYQEVTERQRLAAKIVYLGAFGLHTKLCWTHQVKKDPELQEVHDLMMQIRAARKRPPKRPLDEKAREAHALIKSRGL